MPITKQAKKAMRRDSKRSVHNLRRKREMRSVVKEVQELAESGKGKEAREKLGVAYKAIDKAKKSGVIKQNILDYSKLDDSSCNWAGSRCSPIFSTASVFGQCAPALSMSSGGIATSVPSPLLVQQLTAQSGKPTP